MTADENWPEEPQPGHIVFAPTAEDYDPDGELRRTPQWTSRQKSRERVYEAAKVAGGAKTIHLPDGTFHYGACRHRNGRLEEFFGDTLAEALERMGEAMEMELTKEATTAPDGAREK